VRRDNVCYGFWVIIVFLVTSCSQTAATEESLRARSQSYWEAMIKGNYREAHEYLDPRSRISADKFTDGASKFRWINYRIEEVKVDKTDGNVTLSFTFRPLGLPFDVPELERSEKELWVFYQGAWYYREPTYNVGDAADNQAK